MNWGQGWHFSSQHLVSIMPWKEYQLYELTQCLMRLTCSEFRSRLIIVTQSLESKSCVQWVHISNVINFMISGLEPYILRMNNSPDVEILLPSTDSQIHTRIFLNFLRNCIE